MTRPSLKEKKSSVTSKINKLFTPARRAMFYVVLGGIGVTLGIAMFSVPVAVIIGSALLAAYGLFFVDVDEPVRRRRSK